MLCFDNYFGNPCDRRGINVSLGVNECGHRPNNVCYNPYNRCCCRPVPGPGPIVPAVNACKSTGEMLVNGTMEAFTGDNPNGWTVGGTGVFRQITERRVHAGESSVTVRNQATLSQEVAGIKGGCHYILSFFAHSDMFNAPGPIYARVNFVTAGGNVLGGQLTVKAGSLPHGDTQHFGYYEVLTTAAPVGTTHAIVYFESTINPGQTYNSRVDLDDVSFRLA